MDAGETEAPHIELIEPENDLNPISAGTETLPELVERQDISTIELEQYTGIKREDGNLESSKQRIDTDVPSFTVGQLPVIVSMDEIATPEGTPGVCRPS